MVKQRPVSTAPIAHPPSQPGSILSFPPHLSRTRGLGGPVASHGSHSRSGWDVGRLPSRAQEAAGLGASAETSAALGSRGLPPHPGGARAANSARPPRADESGEGAGGEGCRRAEVGGGGGLWAGGARLAVPAAGRAAAGRSHRARGVRALLPSVVTRRGAPGSGQGLSVAQDKRLTGAERRKVSAVLRSPLNRSPPNLTLQSQKAESGGGAQGAGRASRSVATRSRPGCERVSGCPRPVGTPQALPPPRSPPASSLRMQTKPNPPPPDSQPPGGVPWPQSCPCCAGITADKTYRWEQNTHFLGLFSLLEAQRVEKDTPTSRARLSLEPQDSEPGSHQPLDQWGSPG